MGIWTPTRAYSLTVGTNVMPCIDSNQRPRGTWLADPRYRPFFAWIGPVGMQPPPACTGSADQPAGQRRTRCSIKASGRERNEHPNRNGVPKRQCPLGSIRGGMFLKGSQSFGVLLIVGADAPMVTAIIAEKPVGPRIVGPIPPETPVYVAITVVPRPGGMQPPGIGVIPAVIIVTMTAPAMPVAAAVMLTAVSPMLHQFGGCCTV